MQRISLFSKWMNPALSQRRFQAGEHSNTERFRNLMSGDSKQIITALQSQRELHAINDKGRLELFVQEPKYTVADIDLRFYQNQVVVSHDTPTGPVPSVQEWINTLLPLKKMVALKLDIKDKEAIDPLITLLKQSHAQYPELWQNRLLILNADIPLGNAHKTARIDLNDMKALAGAFPQALLSIGFPGGVPIGGLEWQAIETALNTIHPNPKTVSFHHSVPLTEELLQLLERNNAFACIWGGHASTEAERNQLIQSLNIPPLYREKTWIEF